MWSRVFGFAFAVFWFGTVKMIIVAWHRFGPYHHARAGAAAARLDIVGLEMSTIDTVNAWAPVEVARGFEKITLCPGEALETLPTTKLTASLDALLGELDPSVLIIHGYAARDALALLRWGLMHQRPVIVMSASNGFDAPRSAWREWLKSRLLRRCSAGLAGGTHGSDYLRSLGLPGSRVFVGYDIVDNEHFAAGAVGVTPASVGMPGPFFLASVRFVQKKNLFRLIEAYARYRSVAGKERWQLTVLGDGPLRPEIEAKIAELNLADDVLLPGYKQYDELPAWYGAASCFILPSTTEQWGLVVNEAMAAGLPVLVSDRCGCAPDLVSEGVNGFTFDPYDVHGMADLMARIAHNDVDRAAMGRASRAIVADWGPERFADGLEKAVAAALRDGPKQPSLLDRALLWALLRR